MAVGGRERIVSDLCRTATGQGITPFVFCYDMQTDAEIPVDAPVITLNRKHRLFGEILRGALGSHHIDVVHAHGHIAAALLPWLPFPVISTLHVAMGSGWRWLPAIYRGLRRSQCLTAVSQDLAARFSWARCPIQVIPPGVDTRQLHPHVRTTHEPFTLAIIARLHPIKRHMDLISALHILASEGIDCRLLVAGEGPMREAIATAAGNIDMALLGHVADVPALLKNVDAVVLPSDHEGTPVALMEAMACGLPVVATATGGIPALVGDAGLLVPRRSPEALAAAISKLMSSLDIREQLGKRARARILAFDLETQASAYRRCYDAVLRDRAATRIESATRNQL
ncbi:MAG: glycosyltransferase family 4 protein [Sphingomonas pseudosanguinis]|uniref:glycosyltransferase family 4 protein n=1 Tax=Sphingomonas pseudosanguinis TaxID=413712 RepID=UPI00391AE5CE